MNPTQTLHIHLFGQGRVLVAGEPVKFAKRSATFAMLALLLSRPREPMARTYLAFTLFPDMDESLALQTLRRYLHLTLKALPPAPADRPWLVVDAETIRWNDRADAAVDVHEFQRLAADEATYANAVECYRGDLLEDVYDDWVVVERERLRARNVAMLQALLERRRAERDRAGALAYAARLLAFDPLREDVVRQIMSVRYAAGDSAGALGEFDRFARRLRDELGVSPMSETVALRETILRERPLPGSVDRVSAAAPESAARRAHTLRFIGRASELGMLETRWNRATRAFGNCTFVGGEAGVGKTRLVAELARAVEAQGARVISGGTSSPESSPYQCIVEALAAGLAILRADPANGATLAVLARAFPTLRSQTADGVAPGTLDPKREATRLYGAFASAFEALASPRPLLVVLEDLHWASGATLDALATIARRIDRARVMIVATYRDDDAPAAHPLHRLRGALGIERRTADLHVRRFDRSDVDAAVAAALGPAASDAIGARLFAQSEGNALFLTEALAALVETPGSPDAPSDAATDGIDSIVYARIARLGEAARTVAEIAAICGAGCSIDIVRDVAGFDAAETLDAFGELLDRRLVREAGARDRFEYVFAHNLIGEAIYRGMTDGARVRRHARLARLFERRGDLGVGDVREIARHYVAAGMREAAAPFQLRAAREAVALYANEDAIAFATSAIEGTDDASLLVEALFIREEAQGRLGRRDAQARDAERLLDLVSDAALRCRVLRRIVERRRVAGERDDVALAIEALYAAAAGDPHLRADAIVEDARHHIAIGDYARALALASDALRAVDPSGRGFERALSVRADAEIALGEFEAAERSIDALVERAERAGDRAARCEALLRRVSAATYGHRFEAALASARAALDEYRVIGDRLGEARALSNIATAALRLSRWNEARDANRAAAALCEEIGDRYGVARVEMNLGMLLGRCGDLVGARRALVSARRHHERLGDRRAIAAAAINEGFVALWQGDADAAKRLAREALALAREMDHVPFVATALANLGAAERDLGEFDAAIAHMREGLDVQVRLNRMADGVSDYADLALAHALCGDWESAREVVERLLALEPSWTESAIFPPYPVWIVARVLHAVGDARAAETLAWAARLATTVAASIDSTDLRARFEALPFVREIARARDLGVWPEIAAARDAASAPTSW